ncbi:MAG TPA: FAD-dependent oxidoreductase [Phototrophicaceae bacterium]|nr:FAD-dependent oxidoreductase [Phototrophicaceae bacterium]
MPEFERSEELSPDDVTDTFPVVVIGGGLAGLAAAAHLSARGVPPLILEASSAWAGGRLCGGDPDIFDHNGRTWSFKPDHGVHALWGGYVNMRAMLERFTSIQLQLSSGEEWINRWRRDVHRVEAGNAVRSGWIPAPFHYLQLLFRPRFWLTINPLDFLSLPGFLFSVLWTVGLDPLKEQIALDGLMMSEYFRGWTPNLRATFTGLGANLLAANPESISLTAFIAALRFYTLLRKDAWKMWYLPGNSHDYLIQPLIDHIEQSGGQIVMGATAQSIERHNSGWRVVFEDDARRGLRSIFTEHVILAINAPAAQRLLSASPDFAPPAEKIQFPKALRTVAVRLWFNKQPREGASSGMCTGDFQIDNFFWLHRLYDEFADWRDQGGSAVEVHIYGSETMLDQSDANLLIVAVNEIQNAFPELRGHFVHGAVRRNSRTHTRFRVPDSNSLSVVTPWIGVYACGDWIGYTTPSFWMERATTTGIAAANEVLKNTGHQLFPVLQPPEPELLVRLLALLVRGIRLIFRPVVAGLRRLRHRK